MVKGTRGWTCPSLLLIIFIYWLHDLWNPEVQCCINKGSPIQGPVFYFWTNMFLQCEVVGLTPNSQAAMTAYSIYSQLTWRSIPLLLPEGKYVLWSRNLWMKLWYTGLPYWTICHSIFCNCIINLVFFFFVCIDIFHCLSSSLYWIGIYI